MSINEEKIKKYFFWIRLAAALFLIQTLRFKFSDIFGGEPDPQTVFIFKNMGGVQARYITGIAELFASILLIIPSTVAYGGIMLVMLMSGAIMGHFTVIGISVQRADGTSDGGALFITAIVIFAVSVLSVLLYRSQFMSIYFKKYKGD